MTRCQSPFYRKLRADQHPSIYKNLLGVTLQCLHGAFISSRNGSGYVHARQVALSCESGGASELEVPAWRVVPGRYLLQLSLGEPGHASPTDGRDSAGAGEGNCSEPDGAAWRLYVGPSADARACSLVVDDSFARYLQVWQQWSTDSTARDMCMAAKITWVKKAASKGIIVHTGKVTT